MTETFTLSKTQALIERVYISANDEVLIQLQLGMKTAMLEQELLRSNSNCEFHAMSALSFYYSGQD